MFKTILGFMMALGISSSAWATFDGWATVHLVTNDPQEIDLYEVKEFPFWGCYGPFYGPKLSAFTKEFHVPSNLGCGMPAFPQDINALSCAKVVDSTESSDYMSLDSLVLDLSGCPQGAGFKAAAERAAKLNFGSQIKVTIK